MREKRPVWKGTLIIESTVDREKSVVGPSLMLHHFILLRKRKGVKSGTEQGRAEGGGGGWERNRPRKSKARIGGSKGKAMSYLIDIGIASSSLTSPNTALAIYTDPPVRDPFAKSTAQMQDQNRSAILHHTIS